MIDVVASVHLTPQLLDRLVDLAHLEHMVVHDGSVERLIELKNVNIYIIIIIIKTN